MELIEPSKLSKRKLNELIDSLGGKFSIWERIKLGGIGVGGLVLIPAENPKLPLRFKDATESIKVSVEPLKKGLIVSVNNTKEHKWFVAHQPTLDVSIQEKPLTQINRKKTPPLMIGLKIDQEEFILHSSGWNNKAVYKFFKKLIMLMHPKSHINKFP